MARSYRHTPVHGHAGSSEKQDKRIYNRRLRRAVKDALLVSREADFDSLVLPAVREVSDAWNMSKDGKSYDDSLAAYCHTLRRIVRVRDGRTRKILAISEATYELAAAWHAEMSLRYGFISSSWNRYLASRDANFFVNGIRK